MSTREKFTEFIHGLQDEICTQLERIDGKAVFREDLWEREGGGGGRTRVIQQGAVLEKGGVSTSQVHGDLPEEMKKQFGVEQAQFFAAGISLVLHPENPMAPTVHANFRYFELYDAAGQRVDCWFGGGADLTPYYFFEEDAIHFHRVLKDACDAHHPDFYPRFKQQCDAYFYNAHREEARGIGGLFFDYLRPDADHTEAFWLSFVMQAAQAFLPAYLPVLEKRKDLAYTPENRYWQEIRRGRYVEFNLIHDKGTLFGLRTKGRIESVFMSLPPAVRWDYQFIPEPGTREAELISIVKNPKNWI